VGSTFAPDFPHWRSLGGSTTPTDAKAAARIHSDGNGRHARFPEWALYRFYDGFGEQLQCETSRDAQQ
jgi:hypothetical protein